MTLLKFIYALIMRFVPIDADEFSKIQTEIDADWSKVVTDETHEHYKPSIKTTIKKWFSGAWARLFLAILFIPATRFIMDFMNPKEEQDDDNKFNVR